MPLVVPMAVAGVLSIVRDDILSSAVSSGLSLLGALQSSSSPELKASLEELDVEAVLRTVEAVVNEVESDFNRHTHPHTQHTKPNNAATTTTTGAAAEKELESGWVSIPKSADATSTTTAAATAADTKSAAPAASAAATTPVAVSAAVAPTKFTARKKSSLLNCAGNTAVALSVDQIEDAVSKIHAVLLELDAESRAHSAKYFAAWRSNGFAPLLERLRALQGVLDKRLDLLLKVLSVKSLTTQQLNWAHTHPHAHTTTATAATTAATISASANASVSTIAAASAIAKPK